MFASCAGDDIVGKGKRDWEDGIELHRQVAWRDEGEE
jgi:hypothetical protein